MTSWDNLIRQCTWFSCIFHLVGKVRRNGLFSPLTVLSVPLEKSRGQDMLLAKQRMMSEGNCRYINIQLVLARLFTCTNATQQDRNNKSIFHVTVQVVITIKVS